MTKEFKNFLAIYTAVAMVIFGIASLFSYMDSYMDSERQERYKICQQSYSIKTCYSKVYEHKK